MATVIDITSRIKQEDKFIKFGDKTYKVDDSKNAVTEMYAIIEAAELSPATIDKVMTVLLGATAVQDFNGMAYEDYLVPFFAAMACVQGKTYDEVENSFRQSVK